MLPGLPFEGCSVPLGDYARLLVYSDGVYEVETPDGRMWEYEQFVQFLAGLPPETPVVEALLPHVRGLRGGDALADDFSLLEVRF
jgi:sigma-B regulation protein RsbU (phosphoserine phosphatase)